MGAFDKLLTSVTAAAGAVAPRVVGPVTIRSQLAPEITVDPFAPAASGGGDTAPGGLTGLVLSVVKPEIEVQLPTGPYVFAPGGHPTANYGPFVLAGLGLVGLAIFGAGGLAGNMLGSRGVAAAAVGGIAILGAIAAQGRREEATS